MATIQRMLCRCEMVIYVFPSCLRLVDLAFPLRMGTTLATPRPLKKLKKRWSTGYVPDD